MPDFVQTAVKEIDDQLRVLKDEASRLEAARAALTGGTRRRRPSREQWGRTGARASGEPPERQRRCPKPASRR